MKREKYRAGTWKEVEASDPPVIERLAIAPLFRMDCSVPISFFPGA